MKDRLKKLSQVPLTILDGDRGTNYPNRSEFQDAGFCLFLNTSNVTKTGFDFSSTDFVSKERDTLLRKGKLRRGDIVMTTRGTIGNVAYYGDYISYEHIRINSGMVILRADAKKLDPYFLYSFLRSDLFKKQTRSQGSGSAQPQLPIGSLRNIVIPQLDFADQQDIGKVLATLDAKIELNNRINKELEGMAKLLYDYWFVQFDFPITAAQAAAMGKPKLEGKPYRASGGKMTYNDSLKREIPEGWIPGNLEELGKIVGGSTPSTEETAYFCKVGTPWITPKDLSDNSGNRFIDRGSTGVTSEGIKAASLKLLPAGTVLMSSRAPIGYLAVARNPVTTNQGFKSFVPEKAFSGDYIYFTLKHFMKLIKANASGSTFKEISGGTLKAVRIHLPPDDLVAKFTEHVSSFSTQQSLLEQQNQQLTELRDWLLPMLMNGQVTVG